MEEVMIKPVNFWMSVLLLSISTGVFAQSGAEEKPVQSEAQKSFAQMKTLAGSWLGTVTTNPPSEVQGRSVHITLRVTSMGNALMHEIKLQGRRDEPITMLYL